MSTLINGKIKEWTKLTSGGLNCELENGKITFWSAEKAVLQQTYPKGSIVEIVHDHGTGKVMRPFGDQSEKPTPPPPATAPAPAKTKAVEPEKKTGTVKSVGNKAIPPEETAKRAEDAGFKTGTEVKNAEESEVVKRADENKKAIADANAAKEKAQSDQRMKDNEVHARQLAAEQKSAETRKQPDAPPKAGGSAKVQEPVGHGFDPAANAQQTAIMAYKGNVLTPYGQMPAETWDLVQKGMIPVDETTLQIEVEFSLQIDRFRPLRVKISGQGRERVTKMFAEQFQTMLDIVIPISQRFPRFD